MDMDNGGHSGSMDMNIARIEHNWQSESPNEFNSIASNREIERERERVKCSERRRKSSRTVKELVNEMSTLITMLLD